MREDRVLPIKGVFDLLVRILEQESRLRYIVEILNHYAKQNASSREFMTNILPQVTQALEAMVRDGWVTASYDRTQPLAKLDSGFAGFHRNSDQ
jgi:hypothetical protein